MRIRRTYIGSGGVQYASVSRLISEGFGCSEGEALRMLQADEVFLDDEPLHRRDLPVSELAGRELRVQRERVTLHAA